MNAWIIAWTDTRIRFRDRNGLLLMLAAPLVLSAIIGAALGGITRSDTPLRDIPLVVVNDDEGTLGAGLADVFFSDTLAALLAPQRMRTLEAARSRVGRGAAAAAIYIPPDFSKAIEARTQREMQSTTVQLIVDPAARITPRIIQDVLVQAVGEHNRLALAARVSIEQALQKVALLGPVAFQLENVVKEELSAGQGEGQGGRVAVQVIAAGEADETPFDAVAFFAPSMAVFFLMFTLVDGARALLAEEQEGTLQRLAGTPISTSAILGGKIGGLFLTGLLQLVVLIVASRLLFGLGWGRSPAGLLLMVLSVLFAATSMGALLAAYARTADQAAVIGGSITLVFAAVGGNFLPAQTLPAGLQLPSRLTLNRWALDGFADLTLRGLGARDVLPEAAVLTAMGAFFLVLAVFRFRRRFTG